MSKADRKVIKSEMMKSYIWLQIADGSIEQVEQEVAMFCPIICQEMHRGMGSSKNYPISLPPRLNQSMLSLILDYYRFHQVPGHSSKERKSFDEKFIQMDTKTLCELTSAADNLQLKPLVDLTNHALARMIEGKSPEEICETFHLPDDLIEEEKLEPFKNIIDDPRIQLLNTLYARKRKELQGRDRLKERNGLDSVCHDAKIHDHVREMLKLQNFQGYSLALEDEFNDGDLDDEIDPALKEKIDRARPRPKVRDP